MIKAIIIDDEKRARDVLVDLIDRSNVNIEIIAQSHSVQDAIPKIQAHDPDVVFTDVQMPNYAGYEIVNFLDTIDFEIVFVTAYDRYAIKAFELNAIDYLVKPIGRNRLKEAIERLQQKLHEKKELKDYKALLASIQKKEFKQIVIPELGDRRVVLLDDIIAIEADGAYTKVYIAKNTPAVISKNLKYFEDILLENASFFRSHRAWMINLKHIECINKSSLSLTLSNGTKARIARARLHDFESIITLHK